MEHLSKSQMQVYDMEKYAGGTISVICGSMLLKGEKDIAVLQAAVNELYRINPVLRTRIVETNNGTMQNIEDYAPQSINVLCFADKLELRAYAEAYAQQPIELYGKLCEIQVIILPGQYGLLVKQHHLVSDAWTIALVGTQFNAIINGENPLAFSYSEHLSDEQAYLNGERYIKDKTFFLEQFQKCEEMTYLSDKQSCSFAARRKTFVIDKEATTRLNAYIKAHSSSAYVLFMTALATYIGRIKRNTEKFYIGTALLNRAGNRDKNTMGMFVNTLPLLIELDMEQTFPYNLTTVKSGVFSGLRHQKFIYSDVLSAIRQEYHFGEKLYDVMLSYQNATIIDKNSDVETIWYHCGMQTESLQVHIDDRDSEGVFRIHFDYQIEKFSSEDIDRMYQHMVNLLFDAIEDDNKTLYELEMLSVSEREQLIYTFNDTMIEYQKDKCVHTLIEEQAVKTPNKAAVVAHGGIVTYKELNEQANKIAHSLIAQGIRVGDIVAFALPRRSYMVAVMLGIMKAGGVYLSIALDYPQDRIDYMLKDSQAKAFITEENLFSLLENDNVSNPNVNISSENPCYCIYTSGSTGQPKGLLITHRNLMNFGSVNEKNKLQSYIADNCDVVLACGSVGFDISVFEIVQSLMINKTVVLAAEDEINNPLLLADLINRNNIDCIHCTPTKLSIYLQNPDFAQAVAEVKCFVIGGEAFTQDLYKMIAKASKARIFNGYGPSETTVGVCFAEVNETNISLGKPIANTQIYILDNKRNLLPIGAVGELCIAGDNVGKGYLNRPELTVEKFIASPFAAGKTLYCTGDLASWTADGEIEYVGRIDTQVKIRGLRIELAEIEDVMSRFDNIGLVAVAVKLNDANSQCLVGYYTATDSIDEKSLQQYLSLKLPQYMVPNYYMQLAEMPVNSSGKIDRKSLPLPSFVERATEFVSLETDTERKLSAIWSELLKIEHIGRLDDFFELGGDSLMAIALLGKISSTFGTELSIADIMKTPVLKQLAALIDETKSGDSVITVRNNDEYVLLPQQKAIYAACMKNPDSLAYNMPVRIMLPESISREKLKECFNKVLARHKSLKTYITAKAGEIYGVYDENIRLTFENYKNDDYNTFIRPFELDKAPLIRVGFTEDSLLVDIHHIIMDGESIDIILQDLMRYYNDESLPDNNIEFSDYSAYFYDEDFSEHKDFFKQMLKCDFVPVELPLRRDEAEFAGAALQFNIPLAVINQSLQFAKANKLTNTMLFLGVYGIMLSKYTGQKDILSSVILSNRTHSEITGIVGMFVNTLPVYLPVKGKLLEYLSNIKDLMLNLFEYQELPLIEIADAVGMTDKNAVNTAFVYQSEEIKQLKLGNEILTPQWLDTKAAKFDLLFEVIPGANNYTVRIEYNAIKYSRELIAQLFAAYKNILMQLAKENISDISILSSEEYQKVVFDFNNTEVNYPHDKCVYELFEERAKRLPNQTALIFEDKSYTYRQLDELANGLSASMRRMGVKHGDMVGVLLDRDEKVVLAQLAVLKLGAVFIPIDNRYPEERVKYIISESNAKIIIKNASNLMELPNAIDIEALDMSPLSSIEHVSVDSEDTCYIIFTSGSTGTPKGCTLTNRGLVNFCQNNNILETCNKLDKKICVSVNTISFDYFIAESLLPLTNGYTVVLANEEESINQEKFIRLVTATQANIIQTTPTRFQLYFNDKHDLSYMKQFDVIVTSGEALPLELLRRFHKHSNAKIFNPLGPSECCVWVAGGELNLPDGEILSKHITIGRPIANTQLYILDEDRKPLPIGVAGELCISGDGVGNGYLNRPELNKEKFVANSFIDGKLMFCTGDIARWNEQGEIEYIGRIDNQVKIRGLRIELEEIESVMSMFSGLDMVATAVQCDESGRQYLVGYYTANKLIDESALRQYLSLKLPKYMIPNYFVSLKTLPMTPSGKIARQSLPKPDFSLSKESYIPPTNELEVILCKKAGELLNYEQVGINDDFFELGCDSLKAIELVTAARRAGVYFSLQNIFDYPTVKLLCDYLQEKPAKDNILLPEQFAKYNSILEKNVYDTGFAPKKNRIKTVLLTGGTGFLGAHILDALMKCGIEKVFCLVRNEKARLLKCLQYYFGNEYDDEIDKRIIPVVGDLEKQSIANCLPEYVDCIIHSAASVKHYGPWQYFKSANVDATQHIIDYARKINSRLIYISTISVSGNSMADQFDGYISEEEKHFYESSLYIGQSLHNVYVRSKFEAEALVLDAMQKGLRANIIRMGNLTNRKSDLRFQPNYEDNAFLKRIKAVLELGCFPDYMTSLYLEFSPVDAAARAIITLMQYMNDRYTIFHVNSNKEVFLERMLEYLKLAGREITILSDKEFVEHIRRTVNSRQDYIFEALSNDLDENYRLQYDSNIRINNDFTIQYLKDLGFEWPDIDYAYVKGYLDYFEQIGYFRK